MELKTLITECTAYDFKVMLEEKKPKSWLKSVSAFANGLGGSLFFGIDNDGIVKGLEDVQHVCEEVMNLQGKELFSYKNDKGFYPLTVKKAPYFVLNFFKIRYV